MSVEQEVRTALDSWAEAMIAKDHDALDRLLHPELVYSHSDCRAESKEDVLGKLDRPGGAQKIVFSSERTRVVGDAGYVRADVEYTNRGKDGVDSVNYLNVLHVFVREGGGWRMLARQATRHPA